MGKKNKIRKITGDLTEEFADIFAESPPEESNNSRNKNSVSRIATSDTIRKPTNIDEKDLDDWLAQDAEVSRLRMQIQEMKESHETEKVQWQSEQERLQSELQGALSKTETLQEQLTLLQSEKDEALKSLIASQKQERLLQEQLDIPKNGSDVLLSEMLQQRGLRTHTDFGNFFRLISETSHCWNLFKDCRVVPEIMTEFLQSEVHLIDEDLSDVSGLSGISIPVVNQRCELSGGVHLQEEIRELVTEVLLLGWGRILLLGVPKFFGTFIRNQMGTGTLEVQVDFRESQWVYSEEMKSFSAIFVMGFDRERIPKECPAEVFVSSEPSVGQALQKFREMLQEFEGT